MNRFFCFITSFICLLAMGTMGCAGYTRGSNIPENLRTVHLAEFEDNTIYPMAGAAVTQNLKRVMIEDGTFSFETFEKAPLRVHGKISAVSTRALRYDHNNLILPNEYSVTLTANVYAYDVENGIMLLNGQQVSATDTFLTRNDYSTGIMDAIPSLSAKLAQNILEQLHTLDVSTSIPAEKPLP